MIDLYTLNVDKIRYIEVKTSISQLSFFNTVYDTGGQLWKVKDGMVFINEMSITRHPNEGYKSTWKSVVPSEVAKEIVIYDWPLKNELKRIIL
ncbi:MAG: hypothetical protein JJU13_16560 [Balneolaceae bacterium]|nr:hypothetical protein [Balneolaceae bacterium]